MSSLVSIIARRLQPSMQMPKRKCSNMKFAPLDPKFVAKREKFQAPNDIPVHLKGGPMDQVLYRLTILGNIIGVIWCSYENYKGMYNIK